MTELKIVKPLDNVSIEFILATKSCSPFETVMEVYKVNYGDYTKSKSFDALVEILSPILQATSDIRLEKVLSDILPVNRWKSGIVGIPDEMPVNEVIVRYLICEIQKVKRSKFFDVTESQKDLTLKELIIQYMIPEMKALTPKHFCTGD